MKFINYMVESSIIAMNANNLGVYMDSLNAVAAGYNMTNIGDELTFVPLLTPKDRDGSKKDLLICAGFHGDENSGPWSVIRYLQRQDKINANVSLLPLVNPVGFKQFKRQGRWGEEPNIPEEGGAVILDNYGRLMALGNDGVLNLHEDPQLRGKANVEGQNFSYLYHSGGVEEYVYMYMLSTMNEYFEILHYPHGKEKIIHGVVRTQRKGTWEDILDKEGIPNITTEYSSREDFDKRVECGYELITGFVELMS